jgi:hypothetical protein
MSESGQSRRRVDAPRVGRVCSTARDRGGGQCNAVDSSHGGAFELRDRISAALGASV